MEPGRRSTGGCGTVSPRADARPVVTLIGGPLLAPTTYRSTSLPSCQLQSQPRNFAKRGVHPRDVTHHYFYCAHLGDGRAKVQGRHVCLVEIQGLLLVIETEACERSHLPHETILCSRPDSAKTVIALFFAQTPHTSHICTAQGSPCLPWWSMRPECARATATRGSVAGGCASGGRSSEARWSRRGDRSGRARLREKGGEWRAIMRSVRSHCRAIVVPRGAP